MAVLQIIFFFVCVSFWGHILKKMCSSAVPGIARVYKNVKAFLKSIKDARCWWKGKTDYYEVYAK